MSQAEFVILLSGVGTIVSVATNAIYFETGIIVILLLWWMWKTDKRM